LPHSKTYTRPVVPYPQHGHGHTPPVGIEGWGVPCYHKTVYRTWNESRPEAVYLLARTWIVCEGSHGGEGVTPCSATAKLAKIGAFVDENMKHYKVAVAEAKTAVLMTNAAIAAEDAADQPWGQKAQSGGEADTMV
jgi:hypothetical protein